MDSFEFVMVFIFGIVMGVFMSVAVFSSNHDSRMLDLFIACGDRQVVVERAVFEGSSNYNYKCQDLPETPETPENSGE